MSIRDDITEKMKSAMKAGDKQTLGVLRMLLSELKVAERSGQQYDETDVVKSYAGRLKKNAEEYQELGRTDKAEEAQEELAVVQQFLPEQMSRQEIEKMVANIVEEEGYGPRDLGKVMKKVMSEHGDRVDGNMVKEVAKQKLSEGE